MHVYLSIPTVSSQAVKCTLEVGLILRMSLKIVLWHRMIILWESNLWVSFINFYVIRSGQRGVFE